MITINAQITVPRGLSCAGCKYNHGGKHFCIVFQERLPHNQLVDHKCGQCWSEYMAECVREYEAERGREIMEEAENDNG